MLDLLRPRSSARLPICSAVLGILLLSGCNRSNDSQDASNAPIANDASQTSSASVADSAFDTRVRFPTVRDQLKPLDLAMHAYAEQIEAQVLAQRAKIESAAERNEKPGSLDLEFSIATQTQDFVSAIGDGSAQFGGALPQPLRMTFTQHLPSGKVIMLVDLFSDPAAAIKIFSDEARRRLEADFESRLRRLNLPEKELTQRLKTMRAAVEQGTEPEAKNFTRFLVDGVDGKAIGITLIFPATQVAAYPEGAQQVEVPGRLFYSLIKPVYQDAFDREVVTTPDRSGGT